MNPLCYQCQAPAEYVAHKKSFCQDCAPYGMAVKALAAKCQRTLHWNTPGGFYTCQLNAHPRKYTAREASAMRNKCQHEVKGK